MLKYKFKKLLKKFNISIFSEIQLDCQLFYDKIIQYILI